MHVNMKANVRFIRNFTIPLGYGKSSWDLGNVLSTALCTSVKLRLSVDIAQRAEKARGPGAGDPELVQSLAT